MPNEAKWSNGPWHVNGIQIINTPEDANFGPSVVAEVCYHSNIPWEQNAALIAAAPELLELAKQILLAHEQEECAFPNDIVAGAYAAISKAKGRSMSDIKNKPATPLPWYAVQLSWVQPVKDKPNAAHANMNADSSFAAHACSAYPLLVQAVRDMCSEVGNPVYEALLRELGEL